MEIHPPRPVASVKEFLRELLTITAGILIALSLEGLLQWNHHRELVREARTAVTSELGENRRELAKEEQALGGMQQDIRKIIDLVHQLELHPRMPVGSIHYGFTLTELHSTAWDTARTTGAVSYMPYQEVERYTQVYDLQHDFEELQQRAFASSLDMQALSTLLDRKAGTISRAELSDAERRLGVLLANVVAMQQIAKPLEDRYTKMLNVTSEQR